MNHRLLLLLVLICLGVIAPVLAEDADQTARKASPFAVEFADGILPAGWTVEGDVKVADGALVIARNRQAFDVVTRVTTSLFDLAAGTWDVGGSFRSDIDSPDTSYNLSLTLESLDAADKVVDRTVIGQVTGKVNRKSVRKAIQVPATATRGRLVLVLNKTNGTVWVNSLSATQIAGPRAKQLVDRLQITHPTEGQMLRPDDAQQFKIAAWSSVALANDAQQVTYVVRDYWGNDYGAPETVKLVEGQARKEAAFVYEGVIDLDKQPIDVGRWYEIRATIVGEKFEPVMTHSAFVVLPDAPARRYDWKQIPFTSRNWDNRLPEYMRLSDRLGIRVVGVRSDWSATEPFTMEAPQLDLARSLNMGVLFRAPVYKIEQRVKGSERLCCDPRDVRRIFGSAAGSHQLHPMRWRRAVRHGR